MEMDHDGLEEIMTSKKCDEDPFFPECEVLYEGGPSSEKLFCECKKNPGHPTFIPVKDLKLEHLPVGCQTAECLEYIQSKCDLSMKVTLNYTSPNRPDTYPDSTAVYPYSSLKGSNRAVRCGTGYLRTFIDKTPIKGEPCPCAQCKESKSPKMEYFTVNVVTATHVIFDHSEASKAVFECFYDSFDKEGVKLLYGEKVLFYDDSYRYRTDLCVVECVTHDYDLVVELEQKFLKSYHSTYVDKLENVASPNAFIISHPHGMSKQISFGNILHYTISKDSRFPTDVQHRFEKDTKCCLPFTSRFDSTSLSGNKLSENELPLSQKKKQRKVKGNEDIITDMKSPSLFKRFKQCMKSSHKQITPNEKQTFIMKCGKEYIVPKGTTFTVPSGSKYVYLCNFPLTMKISFPPKTKFTLPNGKDFFLPPETEFYSEEPEGLYRTNKCLNYLTYDIDTCPGSSGAGIFHLVSSCKGMMHPHAGALENRTNRSSLDKFVWTFLLGQREWPSSPVKKIKATCVFHDFFIKMVLK